MLVAKKTGAPAVQTAPSYQLPRAAPEEIASWTLDTPATWSSALPAMFPRNGPSAPAAGFVTAAVAA